jgi:hypothetical protein
MPMTIILLAILCFLLYWCKQKYTSSALTLWLLRSY